MKKIIALILSLCLVLSCAWVAVFADDGYTLTLAGEGAPAPLVGATTYILPAPEAPIGKTFAGWQGELGGAKVFLPAGAEVALEADATLTAVYVGIAMREAPQIRYDIEGLRYITNIDRADLAALRALTDVGYGTLIAPWDYLAVGQSLTHAVLDEEKLSYLDVKTEGAYAENEAIFSIAGSIGHVKNKNFCRTFLAAGYLSVTYTDGSAGYVYAPVTRTDAQLHLYELACKAFDDRSAAEQVFLKGVLDAVIDLKLTCDKNNVITAIAYGPADVEGHQPIYTARYEKNADRIVVTLNEGEGLDLNTDYAAVVLDGMVFDTAFEHDADNVEIGTSGTYLYIRWMAEYSDFY